jgi:hypothetical protein
VSASFGWLTPVRVNRKSGAVAQLVERELCKLEVIGSIPFSSTTLRLRSKGRVPRRLVRRSLGEGGSQFGEGGRSVRKLRVAYATGFN